MANPQLKNGHTRIANEILEQVMKLNLNGTQFRLVLAIWRYSYGFQKTETKYGMSIRSLAELIDAGRSQVYREIKALIDQNILSVKGIDSKGARILAFQKNYDDWGKRAKQESAPSPEDTKPEKEKKKNVKPKYDESNTYYKMATYFYKKVEKVAQDAGLPHLTKKANMQSWADDMRKLIEIDQVDKRLAKEVMDWVVQDDFWKTNILSAGKLRKQFPKLAIKMKAQKELVKPKQPKDPRDKEIALQQWISEGNDPDEFNWND
jgi:phage replication O-like protein O